MNARYRPVHFGPRDTTMQTRADGTQLLRARRPLDPYPAKLTERLTQWAQSAPERVFVGQRDPGGGWRTLTYAQTLTRVQRIGQVLLERNLSPERPIAILSDNSIEHLLLGLAAQHVGIPHSPISSAYSLVSGDFSKLHHVLDVLTPGLVFAQDGARFGKALREVVAADCEVVVADNAPDGRPATAFADLLEATPTDMVAQAHAAVGPDTVAKILFTSGSTGMPKGVINTQRMICANQQQIAQTFPFLQDKPPVLVDWLVWNHTFGGNHNVGIALYNGGSLYIDEGKPVAGAIDKTVANLREIAPTIYFNVPKGFEELVGFFRREPALRETFFSQVQLLFYAGAGMPQHVWDALDELAVETIGSKVVITTGLGCTESGPSALFAHWSGGWSGLLGVPVPGLELKLVADGDKLEARYRGPNVTPGYWRQPDATRAAFDEEGFYLTGDALRLVDAADPDQGLVFDGRIAEDFKLLTGTWVSVGVLRAGLIAAAAPLIQDVVITGHDRDFLGAILFPNLVACRALVPELASEQRTDFIVAHPRIRSAIQAALNGLLRTSTGSSTRIMRALLAEVPASLDTGEATDKGSLNQRAVLRNRAALVAELYEEPVSGRVFVASREN